MTLLPAHVAARVPAQVKPQFRGLVADAVPVDQVPEQVARSRRYREPSLLLVLFVIVVLFGSAFGIGRLLWIF